LNEKPLNNSGFFRYRRNPRRVCVVVRPSVPVRSGVCPSLQVVLSLVSYLFRAADVHFFRTFSGCFSIVRSGFRRHGGIAFPAWKRYGACCPIPFVSLYDMPGVFERNAGSCERNGSSVMFPFIKFALDERGAPARLRGGGPCRPAADVEKGKVW